MTENLPPVSRTDLLDLLLSADELTRNLLIHKALQTGAIRTSDAEQVVAQIWIERASNSFLLKVQAGSPAA
jgi:hypothetical protein